MKTWRGPGWDSAQLKLPGTPSPGPPWAGGGTQGGLPLASVGSGPEAGPGHFWRGPPLDGAPRPRPLPAAPRPSPRWPAGASQAKPPGTMTHGFFPPTAPREPPRAGGPGAHTQLLSSGPHLILQGPEAQGGPHLPTEGQGGWGQACPGLRLKALFWAWPPARPSPGLCRMGNFAADSSPIPTVGKAAARSSGPYTGKEFSLQKEAGLQQKPWPPAGLRTQILSPCYQTPPQRAPNHHRSLPQHSKEVAAHCLLGCP